MRETETEIRPPDDAWPTPEGPTLVGAPPPPPPVAPPPVAGPPPDRRIGAGMLLGLGAILLVAAGVAIAWYLTHRSTTHRTTTVVVTNAPSRKPAANRIAVPRLIGLPKDAALVRIAQLGLVPKVTYQATKKPKGTVVSQNPQEATMLAKGKTVTLVVDSTGAQPKPATTPSTTTTSAQQTTTAPTTTAASAPAQPVQPANATMPDVSSQSEAAAVQAMNQAGILASLTWVPGTDELGTVEAQAKPGGTTLPYHAHVQINLSTGPGQKPSAQVPNVVGKPLEEALATINGAHLRMIYLKLPVSDRSRAGKVVQQSPLGGTAPQNAQMLVWMGAYGK